jgi:hypothetical protein
LTEGVQYPLAFEARFPNAPKLSTQLTNIANKASSLPAFVTALPDLPTAPTLPTLGIKLPGGGPLGGGTLQGRKPMITRVTEGYTVIPTQSVRPTPGGGTATFLQAGGQPTITFK